MREFVAMGGEKYKITISPTLLSDAGDHTIRIKRELGISGKYETKSIQVKIIPPDSD
jgi:hypothetical protein